MTDTIDTEALRALADGATEGPWVMETMRHVYVGNRADGRTSGLWSIVHTSDDDLGDLTEAARDRVMNDAAFIAAARTAIPALLAALAERDAEVARLRGEVEQLTDGREIEQTMLRNALPRLAALDAAEAKVRAVEAAVDLMDGIALPAETPGGYSEGVHDCATDTVARLRAALATPEPRCSRCDFDCIESGCSTPDGPEPTPNPRPLNPDCAAGNKHRACAGDAWDETTDSPTTCACECHEGDA